MSSNHQVHRISLDTYDRVAEELQGHLDQLGGEGRELVTCFQEHGRQAGPLRDEGPMNTDEDPADAVWHQPGGPTFIAIFRSVG